MKSKKSKDKGKHQDKDLETTLKEKITPLLEETLQRYLGISVPKLESDISDKLKNPQLDVYIPFHLPFNEAKKIFKKEFLKKEFRLHQGNISRLARSLNIDRRSIHRLIKEFHFDSQEFRKHKTHSGQDPGQGQGQVNQEEEYSETLSHSLKETLDQYKNIFHPERMEQIYQQLPHLSQNIAKFLPPSEWTWKEAEQEFEKQFLQHSLESNLWQITKTAKAIDLRPETLGRKIKKLKLKK